MAAPKALRGINYLGYAIRRKSFELVNLVNLNGDEKGYLKQGTAVDIEFAHKKKPDEDPDILIYNVHHDARAMLQTGSEPSEDDPVIFKISIGVEMTYETPPLDSNKQKKLKAHDWYFRGCAKPIIQMILSGLLTGTGYKMR